MVQKKGFILRDVCGEKVIVGESIEMIDFGKLVSLNDTAVFLWEKAAQLGNFTAEQLAAELHKEYEVSTEQALADVKRILEKWVGIGIVE